MTTHDSSCTTDATSTTDAPPKTERKRKAEFLLCEDYFDGKSCTHTRGHKGRHDDGLGSTWANADELSAIRAALASAPEKSVASDVSEAKLSEPTPPKPRKARKKAKQPELKGFAPRHLMMPDDVLACGAANDFVSWTRIGEDATCAACLSACEDVSERKRSESTLPKPVRAKKKRKATDPVASLTAKFREHLNWLGQGNAEGWLDSVDFEAMRQSAINEFARSCADALLEAADHA